MTIEKKYTYKYKWLQSLSAVDKSAWDSLAKPLTTPFLEWEWLRLMEVSGSTSAQTGWLPCHLTVWSGPDLIGAAPLYIKGHSAGEFVFDHVWADVADRLGVTYYPKLVGMSPFTPMIGYRFLIAPGENEERLTALIAEEIDRFCRHHQISGCSFHFVDPDWRKRLVRFGYSSWLHQSFAWENQGYQSFDDYLAIFKSNQRRNIKRERGALEKMGVQMEVLTGDQIPRSLPPLMYGFYKRTNDKFGPWGCRYLTPAFFDIVLDYYRRRLVLVVASNGKDESPLGMSFLIAKGDHLYGRYWGCSADMNSLHFNACYYSPIEWAIRRGITQFDPGMGGGHKIRRGFRVVPNYSLHKFSDGRMRRIMETHMEDINRQEQGHITALNREIPLANV